MPETDTTPRPILTLSKDMASLGRIQKALTPLGFQLLVNDRTRDFLVTLKRERWPVFIIDTAYPGVPPADLVRAARRVSPDGALIALVAQNNLPFCVEALSLGATDVLTHPIQPLELKFRISGHHARFSSAPTSSSVSNIRPVSDAALDIAMVRELSDFLQRSLREFMDLERTILELRKRLAEVSGLKADFALSSEQSLLLVDPDPELGATLSAICARQGVALTQAFTGGEALDRAGSNAFDMLICIPELPDLDGQVILTSLKGEFPYIDAVLLREWGSDSSVAVWFNDEEDEGFTSMPMRSEDDLDALIAILMAHRTRREQDKRIALVFKDKHRDYMRKYAALRDKLRDAIRRLRRR